MVCAAGATPRDQDQPWTGAGKQEQGIGKDTILEGVKRAVGPWNFKEVAPKSIFEPFNPWLRAVILRVSEAKDMGDVNRFEFYDAMKTLLAAPPDVLECNEKNIKQHYVLNCMGVVITTNHLTDGIYLPAEDRRHYVAWSDLRSDDFDAGYWNEMWNWYDDGRRLPRGGVSGHARPVGLRSESTAAEDAGVLEHRQRQPHDRGRRAAGHTRRARQSRRRHHRPNHGQAPSGAGEFPGTGSRNARTARPSTTGSKPAAIAR